ncbi:MAG TPA: TatD family deoxyribonuclease [Candidatus Thioglobus sp.]|jgi:TatD DNase family protein|nr:TatD family deoxyribonuclease [Candidatus Thioglobus sp.]HIL42667.1 TatD family deoxyribonuclease [Gammaproteobacteria bacterium]
MLNSHAHIDFASVQPYDTSSVCIVPSVGKQNWKEVSKFSHYSYGIHPWYLDDHNVNDLDLLERYIKSNSPIAIGECGLDYKNSGNQQKQQTFFELQLELAQKYRLPVIIHAVRSTEEVILTLKRFPNITGEIHGFSGSYSQAKTLISMGFLLGFGMQLISSSSTKLRSLLMSLPIESILIETDDHYNPNDIHLVAKTISELRCLPVEKITEQCDNNAISLFNIK